MVAVPTNCELIRVVTQRKCRDKIVGSVSFERVLIA